MNLLSYENFKLKKERSLKILCLCCLVIHFLLSLLLMKGLGLEATLWEAPFYLGSYFTVITICMAVFSGIFIVSEYDHGTIRHALSTGTSKPAFFFTKLYGQFITTLLFVLCGFLGIALAFGIFGGVGPVDLGPYLLAVLKYLGFFLLYLLSLLSLFYLFAFLLRSVGAAIALSLVYATVLESLIGTGLSYTKIELLQKLASNLPGNLIGSLNQYGYGNMDEFLNANLAGTLVIPVALILLCTGLALFSFIKRDIK